MSEELDDSVDFLLSLKLSTNVSLHYFNTMIQMFLYHCQFDSPLKDAEKEKLSLNLNEVSHSLSLV